ncbi:MAG: histidine phosphatase family protein [Micromonosporaceae bacterium]|nr:histidine phosphatase family protein [Micromonosporaceae bacterium]
MAVIYLVRHGQATFRSREYDSLSPLGRKQSQMVGEALRRHLPQVDGQPGAHRVISGAMTRHRETAAECLASLGVEAEPEIDERWNEYDHRDVIVGHKPAYRSRTLMLADLALTGRPKQAFQAMFDTALGRWVEAESGYRETWTVFSERVCSALEELAGSVGSSETVLVFTSGGPISAAAANLLGAGSDVWLKLSRITVNTGVTKVVVGRRGATLISFNDHSHLDGELLTYR